jgi:hypothetical protein
MTVADATLDVRDMRIVAQVEPERRQPVGLRVGGRDFRGRAAGHVLPSSTDSSEEEQIGLRVGVPDHAQPTDRIVLEAEIAAREVRRRVDDDWIVAIRTATDDDFTVGADQSDRDLPGLADCEREHLARPEGRDVPAARSSANRHVAVRVSTPDDDAVVVGHDGIAVRLDLQLDVAHHGRLRRDRLDHVEAPRVAIVADVAQSLPVRDHDPPATHRVGSDVDLHGGLLTVAGATVLEDRRHLVGAAGLVVPNQDGSGRDGPGRIVDHASHCHDDRDVATRKHSGQVSQCGRLVEVGKADEIDGASIDPSSPPLDQIVPPGDREVRSQRRGDVSLPGRIGNAVGGLVVQSHGGRDVGGVSGLAGHHTRGLLTSHVRPLSPADGEREDERHQDHAHDLGVHSSLFSWECSIPAVCRELGAILTYVYLPQSCPLYPIVRKKSSPL